MRKIIDSKLLSKQVRRDIVDLTYKAGTHGTHLSGSLSAVEVLSVLYNEILRYNPNNLTDENRDRFILSKGHGAMCMYAVMNRVGILSNEDMATFKQNGSAFSTHPYMNVSKGIEFSTGSLGHGLPLGVGSAIALKKKGNDTSKVFVMMGDGECDEGSIWEAAMSAATFKLDNIILIIDKNQLQLDGRTTDIMNLYSLHDKWKSFGWNVYEMDGHDTNNIREVMLSAIIVQNGPIVFIANTIKGKGLSFVEFQYNWHIGVLTEELYKKAIEELEAHP